jgi:hypothetical protein
MSDSISKTETLRGHIQQNGVSPGTEKLKIFQKALFLRNAPDIYSQEHNPHKEAVVKFFDPCSSWTWYAVEWDRKELCFGYVKGHEGEWGYFNLRELAHARGRLGIGIEVDECFTPQRVPEAERSKTRNIGPDLEPGD